MNFKNLFASLVAILLFTVVFAGTTSAQTTYYVDGVGGNDSWSGTSATFQSGNVGPKKTIQAMVNAAATGDIIEITAATYNETVTLTKRIQLKPTGAINVQNVILNTGSSTLTEFGNTAGNSLTVTGTLTVQSGNYKITNAGQVVLGAGGTYELYVGGTSAAFDTNPVNATAGNYTLKFLNPAALAYTTLIDIPTANPKNVFFNGSALVTLPAAITAQTGDLTIASGASVNLNGFDIAVQGGDFTNNGSYYGAGAEKVEMTTSGGVISGTGTFQNLTFTGAFTWSLGNSITFNNVSQATASLVSVSAASTLDFKDFNLTTPGSATISGAVAYSGAGATAPGTLVLTGSLGTIGTVTFTVPGGGLTLKNLTIDKPSGSTVTLAGGSLTIDKQLSFTGGIFNIAALNLTLSNNHGATASIGGNINGTGNFTIGGGASTADITVSGAGQINCPFVVNATPKTVTFTQLTTIGNNLTLTSGNLTTSSLQLINGTVTAAAGILTLNTTNVSITNTVTLNGASQLKGSSNVTISGALTQNATSVVNMTGSLSATGYTGAGSGNFTAAGLTTTAGGNITTGTGTYTVNGNLVSAGTLVTSTGAITVTGNTSSGGVSTLGGNLTTVGFSPTGALTFSAASVLTVSGSLTAGSTVNFATATSAAITSNFSAAGTVTMGAGAVTVGGNFTISGSGNDFVGAAGNLTVTGVASIADDVTLNTGTTSFNGTDAHTFGGKITSGANSFGTLTVGGPATVSDLIQPVHNGTMTFNGKVTMNGSDTENDVDMGAVANGAATINFNGGLTADDVTINGLFANTINFSEGTALTSQINDLIFTANAAVTVPKITVGAATADKAHTLSISGDVNIADPNALVTVGTNGRVVMNGTGDLHTYANTQTITLTANTVITNLEIANTGTDSNTSTSGGGNAETNETKESVNISGAFTLTVQKLWLTSNGILGTGLAVGDGAYAAGSVTVTRSAGAIEIANHTAPGDANGNVNLVYNNTSALTTGREYTVSAAGLIEDMQVNGAGKVTLSGVGTLDGDLTIATGAELANGAFALTVNATEGAANTAKVTVNGTFSGTAKLIVDINDNFAYTVKGTGGSISNLEFDFAGTANAAIYSGPATLTGNLTTVGGAGVLTYASTAPATIGGNATINVTTFTTAADLAVTGNFTHTLAATTLGGALNVTGNYSQAAGTVNVFATKDVTVTGNYTSTGGAVAFPAASTSNFVVKGTTHSTAGATTYTFGAGSSGRFIFNGAAAQTLTLGANTTLPRMELNTAAGLTMSGAGVNLTVNNLKLTAGTFTHNGLLTMPGGTDRIIRVAGALASFAASGPGEVEYAGTGDLTTGFELVSVLNKLIVNAESGNPTFTLDKNVTILTGGQLNLSRGTLAIGSNALITQNTNTVTRAEGFITGTPTYGTPLTLQYFNTVNDLTTGPEFTNDGKITSLVMNSPGKKVILGANVKVDGNAQVQFGTLDIADFTLDITGNLDNDASIVGTAGVIKFTGAGASNLTGTGPVLTSGPTLTFPNIEVAKNNGVAFVLFPDVAATDYVFNNLTLTDGTFAINAITADDFTVNGAFTIGVNFDNFNTANADDWSFKGNFTINDDTTTPLTFTHNAGDTFIFNGTVAQTITSAVNLLEVTMNNSAGATLGANLVIPNGGTLTLTSGALNTGSFYVQAGLTAGATITRTGGGVNGNLYRWGNSEDGVGTATTNTYLFPMITSDAKYRPITVEFTDGTTAGLPVKNHIMKVTHSNVAPTGTVGLPIVDGAVTVNKTSPLSWTVGMYDAATPANFLAPGSNPKVIMGAGGVQYGDITKVRAIYRLTNELNTWQLAGTFTQAFYDLNGVPTVQHSGVQGWQLEPQQIFTIGFSSSFAVANALTAQTLVIGGTAYTKDVAAAPAVFSGNQGTLTYSVTSSDVTKATAAITAAGVLTVTAVAEGTSTITVTATDINAEQKSSAFTATVQAKPAFTSPVAGTTGTFTVAEAATSGNTVTFAAAGTAGITYEMLTGAPSWAAFNASTGVLTLTPTYGDAGKVTGGIYTITIRAKGANNLTQDFVLTVTVTTTLRAPMWTGTGTTTIAIKSIKYNEVFNFNYVAVSPDNNTITYSLVSVTPTTTSAVFTHNAGLGGFGNLVFTPTTADAGKTYTIVVRATDSKGLTSTTQTLLTVGVNSAPAFTAALTSRTIKVHNVPVAFTFEYKATDADSDPIAWTLVSGKGNISATGMYSWTPVSSDKGTTNSVTVRISDKNNPLIFKDTTAVLTVENVITSVEKVDGIPTSYSLAQNYPNPFNPSTVITFGITEATNVRLAVYNILGEQVAMLVNDYMTPGFYKYSFNASNLPSGIYIYKITANNFTQTKKMLLTK